MDREHSPEPVNRPCQRCFSPIGAGLEQKCGKGVAVANLLLLASLGSLQSDKVAAGISKTKRWSEVI